MDEKYFPEVIEEKWQRKWAETKVFTARRDDMRPKFYALEMLPYPSGFLHMGHVRNYSIGDSLAWYKRLKGFNVLHPIGWDSFGQPAEQAAIKRGVNPREWTEENIVQMRGQLQRLGLSYDWTREFAAHRPDYYKFDQWFFLKMYERGLAYKKMTQVNWCENDQTTLSNEQASGGICWRCGNPTTKKDLEQWFLRITDYADQLLDDMREIEAGWAEKVLKRQRDWIGRSKGTFVTFKVQNSKLDKDSESIKIFTTRIDTIYGANAIVVAAEHPFIESRKNKLSAEVLDKIAEIKAEKAKAANGEEELEKNGIFTGFYAVNPFGGEQIPIWVANYVLMEYGTGAVMSVPAHDERDFEFAKKYDLPILPVIVPAENASLANKMEVSVEDQVISAAFVDDGALINSGEWSGETSENARRAMTAFAAKNNFGEAATTYRLRDWGISRQRFWGAPIPIVYCDECGIVPEKEENLPVELPENAPFTGVGESPLARVPEFVNTVCPNCSKPARRETDTMDTFVDSSWYMFRYTDPHNAELPFAPEAAAYWTPVDQYIGGDDHAVMHLIYTRFWTKVMRDIGLVKFNEPAKRLLTQGMVVGETFYDDSTGKAVYYRKEAVEIERDAKGKITGARLKENKKPLKYAVERMSKSKGNGVNPDEMIEIYGADAARIYVLFSAPVENELVWNDAGIEGASRFIQRVYRFVWRWRAALQTADFAALDETKMSAEVRNLRRKTHETIRRVEEDFERLQLNTPIAALMELSNALGDLKIAPETAKGEMLCAVKEAVESLILMLVPFAPHAAEEMYAALTGEEHGILASGAKFPAYREDLAQKTEIEIPVQVNGKLRSRIYAAPSATKEELEQMALADAKTQEYINGKSIVKIVVVPNRLVNVVIKS
jgi:leucyl-tRNA synthetase